MRMLCICPTYGRHPDLIANSVACFLLQNYDVEECFLIVGDDARTLREHRHINWAICHCDRMTVPAKYNHMWRDLGDIHFPSWEAMVIWEDDDLYLPHHLSTHADALQGHEWSYPDQNWSTYGHKLHTERKPGLFHASIAVRRSLLERIGGWPESDRAIFDQELIWKLQESGEVPATPYTEPRSIPSYVYRWPDTGNHVHFSSNGPQENGIIDYANYPIQHPCPPGEPWNVSPRLDQAARGVFDQLGLACLA